MGRNVMSDELARTMQALRAKRDKAELLGQMAPELLDVLREALQEHDDYMNGKRALDAWVPKARALVMAASAI
jgi:hypothetical protein